MKVIDKTLLKTYVGPFILTFLVVLFVFVMQFLWKYVDDLVGRGVEWYLIFELIFFMSFSFVPMSIALGVLFSTLITFGNLSERNELTAMKSAGIPLYRIMQPLLLFAVFLSGLTFVIANNGVPVATLKGITLLRDIQNQKPALTIEEGIFYRGFDDYVIRIGKKDKDNQTIYDVMIYDHSKNTGHTSLTYGKRGTMVRSNDEMFLVITLEDGAIYDENVQYDGSVRPAQLAVLRGTFEKEQIRLDLSSFKMQRTSEEFYKDSYEMLNISQLGKFIDTMKSSINEDKFKYGNNILSNLNALSLFYVDSLAKNHQDTSSKTLSQIDKQHLYTYALQAARDHSSQLEFSFLDYNSKEKTLWRYEIEWHKKYAIAVACVLLFFIGAPLGSIIKKGGLGVPMLLSIVIFVIYWILSTMGERMSRIGVIEPWIGMWASTFILLPFSLFLTYKASVEAKMADGAVNNVLMRISKYIPIVKTKAEEIETREDFINSTFNFTDELYNSFRKNSKIAFVLYIIAFPTSILSLISSINSEILYVFVIIFNISTSILYFIFLIKSFLNQSRFYKAIGQDYRDNGVWIYIFLGMPFYIFMYFYFRNQMKEKMSEIK